MDDPIVEEVHKTRQRIFAECNEDLDRLIARLKAGDSRNKARSVTLEDVRSRNTEALESRDITSPPILTNSAERRNSP